MAYSNSSSSCPGGVCGKPKSFVDLSWSNRDKPLRIQTFGVPPQDNPQLQYPQQSSWCNTDPTVYVCGHTNTDNVGFIPMRGACSEQTPGGFLKKQYEDSTPPNASSHLRVSQTYLGDISPMFGAKRAYENVYGPIIRPVPVETSTLLVYPDGQPYPQPQYI